MGGLGSALPKTKWMMWIGTVALIGFWPFSKDDVLAAALQKGGATADIVWVGGLIGAFFTGIYATRLMRLTFYGERSQFASEHLHSGHGEAPWVMFWTVAAARRRGRSSSASSRSGSASRTPSSTGSRAPRPPSSPRMHATSSRPALAWLAGGGAAPADLARLRRPRAARAAQAPVRRDGRRVAEHKFYWDELYDRIAYIPAAAIATGLYRFFERWVIWGTIDLVAYIVRRGRPRDGRRPDRRRPPVRRRCSWPAGPCSACTSSRRRRCDHRADLPAPRRRAARRRAAAVAAADRVARAGSSPWPRPCSARSP